MGSNSEWPFHNFETSSERVFVSVLTQGNGAALSGEEVITKLVSLAEHHRVIKDDNYSSVSSVKAGALSRHDCAFPCLECTNIQALCGLERSWLLCPSAKDSFSKPSPLGTLTWQSHSGGLHWTLLP